MKIKRITITVDEADAGIVFELADGRTGRAIVPIDPALRDNVLASASQSLDAAAQELGSEAGEPGALTSALMKLRIARQEEALANKRIAEAEALLGAKREDLAVLDDKIAQATAAAAKLG